MGVDVNPQSVQFCLSLDEHVLSQVLEQFGRIVEDAVEKKIKSIQPHTSPSFGDGSDSPQSENVAVTGGVEVLKHQREKAADLRTALLLGKIPEEAGLLIDSKEMASLMNIAPRTLSRLTDLRVVPAPVRIGRLVRWRLTEVLEWIEADCPPQNSWKSAKASKKRSR